MSNPGNGQRRPLETPRSQVIDLFANLNGAGAADLVNADSAIPGGGEIVTAVRTGAGTYNITFRKLWAQLIEFPVFSFMDPTASAILGFDGVTTAINVVAGTATFVFGLNNTPTDIPATSFVSVRWAVRPVNKN